MNSKMIDTILKAFFDHKISSEILSAELNKQIKKHY